MSHRAFDGYVAAQTANGVDGYNTVIRAQSATGTSSDGGNLILTSGSGTASDGYVSLVAGNTEILRATTDGLNIEGYITLSDTTVDGYLHTMGDTTLDGYLHTVGNTILDGYLHTTGSYNLFDGYIRTDGYLIVDGYTTVDGYEIIFDGYAEAPFIRQLAMPTPGIDGYHLTIRGQASTTSPAHGGNVVIKGGDGYNGDGYNRDGYVQLFSGATEVIRIAVGKQIHTAGERFHTTAVTTSPYDVLATDMNLLVDTTATRTINLPPNPSLGDAYRIKDSTGTAGANNITIEGNGHNIEGSSSNSISTNFGRVAVVFNGTQWVIF